MKLSYALLFCVMTLTLGQGSVAPADTIEGAKNEFGLLGSSQSMHKSESLLGAIAKPKISHPQCTGAYYNWGQGQDGWGYCYEWTCDGMVLNGGAPVANSDCDYYSPSYFNWGRGQDGGGHCYQWTPYGIAMNMGQPVGNDSCEYRSPSHYSWGRGQDGNAYCYDWTPQGYVLNDGQPVPQNYCTY